MATSDSTFGAALLSEFAHALQRDPKLGAEFARALAPDRPGAAPESFPGSEGRRRLGEGLNGLPLVKPPYVTYYHWYQAVLLDPEGNVFRINFMMS